MTPEEKELAAIAYRRAHMTWREIGKRVGADKDDLRIRLASKVDADRSRSVKTTSAPSNVGRVSK